MKQKQDRNETERTQRISRQGVKVRKGPISAETRINIGGGHRITSTITVSSAEWLQLAEGSEVSVVVKARDVILGVDDYLLLAPNDGLPERRQYADRPSEYLL